MLIKEAHSFKSLCAKLRNVDIAVPGRGRGRKNEHRERWTICRLVATLAASEELRYPISLDRRSPPHPDYLLSLNSRAVGIEVTEATYHDYNRCLDLLGSEYPHACLDVGLFVPARYDASGNRIPVPENVYRSQLEQNTLVSEGWSSAEPDWVRAVRASIDSKQARLLKHYQRASVTNWLAIKSNLPCEGIELKKAMNALYDELKSYWQKLRRFERIFIERGDVIISITSLGWTRFEVNNLWEAANGTSKLCA